MTLLNDILSKKKHLENRVLELVELCQIDATGSDDLHERIRNNVQEILQTEVRLLDNLAYCIFKKHHPDMDDSKSKIYFPYKDDEESLLRNKLADLAMGELREKDIDIYKIIEKHQPYHSDAWWNKFVHEYANVGHIGLVPQRKQGVIVTPFGTFSENSNVHIKNFVAHGKGGLVYRLDEFKIDKDKGNVIGYDPKTMEYQFRYLHPSSSVDMIELCIVSNNKIQEIILELEPILSRK